ncbi:MAG: permease [Candidatus Omnitrophica bacterium]|nr:permease [Candidatus Omnitrophota bacterium]
MAQDPICGMKVNEKKSLQIDHESETFFFCSQSCLEKFAQDNKIPQLKLKSCLTVAKNPFYKNKTFIVALAMAILSLASYFIPLLEPFRKTLFNYFKILWWAIALGLLVGGVIEHYIPRHYISLLLSRPRKRTIFYSVFLGFLMSVCSHGILAISIQLHKKGASNPAVVAFLLASPWANMVLTIMLIGLFGLKALFIIISAIIIAIITGFIFQFLENQGLIESNTNTVNVAEDFSVIKDLKLRIKRRKFSFAIFKSDLKGIYKGAISLSNMVLWWILIGTGLASLAGAYIPSSIFSNYMGPTVLGLLVTLAVATVIEVCSEGSAPLAFEIFKQTGALGNSFVFLMAGVVIDYTEIGLLWHNVGRRVAIWLPIVTVPQVIVLGFIANLIF